MPAPVVEVTQIVARNELRTSPFEPVAVCIGIATFVTIVLSVLLIGSEQVQVDRTVSRAMGYGVVVALVIWARVATPTARLTPLQRAIRTRRRIAALLGLLAAISVLGSIVVAYSLHTWWNWLLLVVVAISPIGLGLLINVRFSMGSSR